MIDVLYAAWNRLEYTRASFELLLANTCWERVRRLVIYDDGSEDGTREYLDDARRAVPVDAPLVYLGRRSPVAVMNHYLDEDPAPVFAKIDNDIAVPPGWLDVMLDVWERADVDLLGMEAGRTGVPGRDGLPEPTEPGGYGWEPCSHIGGVGLMRAAAFSGRPRPKAKGRFGFTEWQYRDGVRRAWVAPDLMVPQLDRVPIEPWRSLSFEYVARGWQRTWPDYSPRWMRPYFAWLPGAAAALDAEEAVCDTA